MDSAGGSFEQRNRGQTTVFESCLDVFVSSKKNVICPRFPLYSPVVFTDTAGREDSQISSNRSRVG